jgi:hypothetical protein
MRANHVFALLFLLLILIWSILVFYEYKANNIRDFGNMAQDQLPHGGTDEKPVIHSPEPSE